MPKVPPIQASGSKVYLSDKDGANKSTQMAQFMRAIGRTIDVKEMVDLHTSRLMFIKENFSEIKRMVKESMFTLMERSMRVTGDLIDSMGRDLSIGLTVPHIMASMPRVSDMVKESSSGMAMEESTRVLLKMTRLKALVPISGWTTKMPVRIAYIEVNGSITRCRDLELSSGLMANRMKANFSMTRNMATAQ